MSLLTSAENIDTSFKLPLLESSPMQTAPNMEKKKAKKYRKKTTLIFPKLYPCREVELVTNLSMDSTNDNPMMNSLMQEKEKERIDTSVEVMGKRRGLKRENSDINEPGISQIEKEFKSAHSKEFYMKYETLQREKKKEDEIMNQKKEINELKDKRDKLYETLIKMLSNIYNCDLDIMIIDSDEYCNEKKNEALMSMNSGEIDTLSQNGKKKKGNNKKKLDLFVLKKLNIKEQALKNEKKNEINAMKLSYIDKVKELKGEIDKIKDIISQKKKLLKKNIKSLLDHYHNILYEGLDARQEGLMWTIKSIWNLGENVKMSFFPSFLDPLSVDYLFSIAHKSIEISQLKCEIEKNKMKLHREFTQLGNKSETSNKDIGLFRTSLDINHNTINMNRLKHKGEKEETKGDEITLRNMTIMLSKKDPLEGIFRLPAIELIGKLAHRKEKIEREIRLLRKKEMKRIFKLFIENNYENKYNVSIETVIAALVGEINKDRELVDYAKMRKKYFDNLRNIEYFSICKKPKNMKYGQKLHFASFTNSL